MNETSMILEDGTVIFIDEDTLTEEERRHPDDGAEKQS